MSREIDYIQNVTAFATLAQGANEFSIQGGFPTNPDEVVIRQITYGHTGVGQMLLIHSNLSNGIIACIGDINGFTSNPGTRIQTRNPVSNVLTFKLMSAATPATPVDPADVDLDQICISMDFIRYKK